jgi:hypothetical protein
MLSLTACSNCFHSLLFLSTLAALPEWPDLSFLLRGWLSSAEEAAASSCRFFAFSIFSCIPLAVGRGNPTLSASCCYCSVKVVIPARMFVRTSSCISFHRGLSFIISLVLPLGALMLRLSFFFLRFLTGAGADELDGC